jgi:cytidylate kinase
MAGFFASQQEREADMTVITISRQFGSYGDEIAKKLCEMLNYHYFDKHLVLQAAVSAGISEQELVDYSEENYKVRNFLDRLLGGPQIVTQAQVWRQDAVGTHILEVVDLTETAALELIQKAIRYAHSSGDMVIVGRGGQVLLQNEPDVLHVRIEAPFETRLERVREQWRPFETRVDLRRSAQDMILEKDDASADYLQRFYNVRWDDPDLYHLVINTGKLGIEQAANLIALAARELTTLPERAGA